MAACPNCKQEIIKLRKGVCPNCGQELKKHSNGMYYRSETGSPSLVILKWFEDYVSIQASKKQGMRIAFTIPRKGAAFSRELVEGERLLADCEGDLELVKMILDVLFNNPQFSWKARSSLIGLRKDALLAKAIALSIRVQAQEKDNLEDRNIQMIMSRENLFD